jgi:hypothetical protein
VLALHLLIGLNSGLVIYIGGIYSDVVGYHPSRHLTVLSLFCVLVIVFGVSGLPLVCPLPSDRLLGG